VNKNPCIVSIFMPNVPLEMAKKQNQVVKKFNKSGIKHLTFRSDAPPGNTMDAIMEMMWERHDAIMFLDIDAVPVHDSALDYFFEQAYAGKVIGSAQRSNHIQNNQHIFCAPHNITLTFDTFSIIGKPSFQPNSRGDVSEEITFRAEESGVPVEILMPVRYDAPPIRMDWEPKNSPPYWDLADGMPKYGIGTTFDKDGVDMFWHMYQSFYPGQTERFINKCEEILNGK